MAVIKLTAKENDALVTLLAAIINDDDGFLTYGLNQYERASVCRGFNKLCDAQPISAPQRAINGVTSP